MPRRREHVCAADEVAQVDLTLAHQVAHRDFHDRHGLAGRHVVALRLELLERRGREVEIHVRHGTEPSALDEHRLLVEHLRRLKHLAFGREHRHAREPELHEPQAHHAIVDVREVVAREVDDVDLDAVRAEPVEQRLEQRFGLVVQEARAVDEIHADDAERFLLERVLDVEHAHMDDDLVVGAARLRLVLDAHPAVALVVAAETARGNRVGEREERGAVAARSAEPLDVEPLLVVEHRLQAVAMHVARAGAVDRVADLHVVSGDALRDRAGRTARAEEPANDFLPRADLGEGSVVARVEVDLERFFPGPDGMLVHVSENLSPAVHGVPDAANIVPLPPRRPGLVPSSAKGVALRVLVHRRRAQFPKPCEPFSLRPFPACPKRGHMKMICAANARHRRAGDVEHRHEALG